MGSKLLGLLLLFSFFGVKSSLCQTDVSNAQAMYVYNFLSHVLWPENQIGDKYVIGVLGKTDTYNKLVDYTKQRRVGNRSIEVKQCNSFTELQGCHVILVAFNSSSQIAEVTRRFAGKSCLIVSEKAGSNNLGSIIEFELVDNKLRYRVNKPNAEKHKLYVSAALMKMSL